MTSAELPATVRILAAPGAGDNRQLDALARAIAAGTGARVVREAEVPGIAAVIAGRLARALGLRGRHNGRIPLVADCSDSEWVLIAGGRSVDPALARREGGLADRVICLGRPWAPLDWFDRVITTPQYRLPEHPAVVHNLLPLDRPSRQRETADGAHRPDLPQPRLGILVGGPSGSYRFPRTMAGRLAAVADAWHSATGGGAEIVASARTPVGIVEAAAASTAAPCMAHPWRAGEADNPYPAILAGARAFAVTADSASMLADALRQRRPTALVNVPERWRPRLLRRLRSRNRRLAALRDRLVVQGLWFPARDLDVLHAGLIRRGVLLADAGRLRPDGSVPGDVTREDLERALASLTGASGEATPAASGAAGTRASCD